jgi:hypothetical protein
MFTLQYVTDFRFLFNGSFLLFLNYLSLTACISVDVHTSGWIQETAVQHRRSCYWQDWPHEGYSHSTSTHIVGARGNVMLKKKPHYRPTTCVIHITLTSNYRTCFNWNSDLSSDINLSSRPVSTVSLFVRFNFIQSLLDD